jgi:protein involved in polysaccharide export with SLBB domain
MHRKTLNYDRAKTHTASAACILLAILVVSLTACTSNFPHEEFSETIASVEYGVFTLGPGDSIRIRVFDHPDLSGSYNIDDTGIISLPLSLGINTQGLTLRDLEQKVTDELTANFIANPKVSVDLVRSRPFCILGEVRNPGCFSGIHGMNTVQAIAVAGGYTYRAYKEKIAITREDGRKLIADTNTPVFGGDTIEVFERYF